MFFPKENVEEEVEESEEEEVEEKDELAELLKNLDLVKKKLPLFSVINKIITIWLFLVEKGRFISHKRSLATTRS